MLVNNKSIANLLNRVAVAYSIKDEKKFRFQILAYQKAAETISNEVREVIDLYKEHQLDTIPGVGASLQKHLEELCRTGSVTHFETILKDVPEAVFPLLDLPTIGPKTAYKLVTAFKLNNPKTVLKDLLAMGKQNKIATLEGFGEKSQNEIIKTIEQAGLTDKAAERMTLPFASQMADQLIEYMRQCKDVKEIYTLGSLRRRMETIGDIDIAVATDNANSVLNHFINYPYKSRLLDRGDVSASILATNGRRIDIKTQSADTFGAMLQHFTGNKEHNVHLREIALKKGMSLSEKGIKFLKTDKMKTYKTEEEFYAALGMQWIPPEMREDLGEIELAQKHLIPTLVELKDIKGEFHVHSSFNIEPSHDLGVSNFAIMLKKADDLNYKYLGFSEHNPSVSKHSSAEIFNLVKKRNESLDKSYSSNKCVRIFKLLETDILTDGRLAIDEKSLNLLDASIVSIHSSFNMDKETMTNRIIKGLSHPKAKILAHPTGRLINTRPGYQADWDKIFRFCQQNNKALEINAYPSRLDLISSLVRKAREYKLKFTIDTDSHAVDQMSLMPYGVDVAKKGWLTRNDIINCLDYEEVIKWMSK